jgi:hypothetical protein
MLPSRRNATHDLSGDSTSQGSARSPRSARSQVPAPGDHTHHDPNAEKPTVPSSPNSTALIGRSSTLTA